MPAIAFRDLRRASTGTGCEVGKAAYRGGGGKGGEGQGGGPQAVGARLAPELGEQHKPAERVCRFC